MDKRQTTQKLENPFKLYFVLGRGCGILFDFCVNLIISTTLLDILIKTCCIYPLKTFLYVWNILQCIICIESNVSRNTT